MTNVTQISTIFASERNFIFFVCIKFMSFLRHLRHTFYKWLIFSALRRDANVTQRDANGFFIVLRHTFGVFVALSKRHYFGEFLCFFPLVYMQICLCHHWRSVSNT